MKRISNTLGVLIVAFTLLLSHGCKKEAAPQEGADKTVSPPDSNGKELTSAPVTPVIPSETQQEIVDDSMQSASRKEAAQIATILTDCYDNWRKMKTLEMDLEMDQGMDGPSYKSPDDAIHLYLENSFKETSEGEKYSYKISIEFRHPKVGIFDFAVGIDGKGWEWRRDRQGNLVGDIKPDRKDEFQGLVYPVVSLFRELIADSREDTLSRIIGMKRASSGNLRENVSIDFGDGDKVSSTLITIGIAEFAFDEHKRLCRVSYSRRGVEWLFNQYTNVDGLWYPQKITLIHKGRGAEAREGKLILKLSNIRINKGVPPEKFTLPKS
jgi:hypothetical protein